MTTQDRLDEARIAYHRLTTGTAPRVFVDQNGERVEYVMANANRLKAYIAELEAQLASARTAASKGPLRPFF